MLMVYPWVFIWLADSTIPGGIVIMVILINQHNYILVL